jgi:alpha-amylase
MSFRLTAARSGYLVMLVVVALLFGGCGRDTVQQQAESPRTAFVHLFEWDWPRVARECEEFLGPAGYAAVQVSPPQEHVEGPQWWTRYQPVSYQLVSRGGSREQFADAVARCRAVDVEIYVDAVINHMTGVYAGRGVAGTEFGEYEYPGLYAYDDFHHCDRNDGDDIVDFDDLYEVQHCELVNLADLDTASESVRTKLAGFLNDLLATGVAGFRIDAAKHMPPGDIAAVLDKLDKDAFVFQEVIYHGSGPIAGSDYLMNGSVTEFQYSPLLEQAFVEGNIGAVRDLGSGETFLPSNDAVVFVDNHDTQRGHWGEAFNYRTGDRYILANVFMLAYPYGYPKVMSSYEFDDKEAGPPAAPADSNCGEGWVCEHRNPAIAGMVGFRNLTHGEPATNWQEHGESAVSFGRGDRGHVVLNAGDEPISVSVKTNLPPGDYCNILAEAEPSACDPVTVSESGTFEASVEGVGAIAIHTAARAD